MEMNRNPGPIPNLIVRGAGVNRVNGRYVAAASGRWTHPDDVGDVWTLKCEPHSWFGDNSGNFFWAIVWSCSPDDPVGVIVYSAHSSSNAFPPRTGWEGTTSILDAGQGPIVDVDTTTTAGYTPIAELLNREDRRASAESWFDQLMRHSPFGPQSSFQPRQPDIPRTTAISVFEPTDAQRRTERVPTLRVPTMEDIPTKVSELQCIVCTVNRIRISLGCGHAIYCRGCAATMAATSNPVCSVCREPITVFARCFI